MKLTLFSPSLLDEELAAEKAYWLKKIDGTFPVVGIPLDFQRPGKLSGKRNQVHFKVAAGTANRLLNICRGNHTLLFTFLVAVLDICLCKYTGVEDIVVATTAHKQHSKTATLNQVLLLRQDVPGNCTFKRFLRKVKHTLDEAYVHQKYPFERILDLLQYERPENRAPLFDIAVVLENINDVDHLKHMKNDLSLIFAAEANVISATAEYTADLFKQETIKAFIRRYQHVLQTVVAHPNTQIADIVLATTEEKEKLLFEFNATAHDYPKQKTIHQLLEKQVVQTPDRIALVYENQHLTYQALNERANQLARHLQGLGIGPEVPVGICMERSLEMVVGLLGILKAGGAYVPLDPSYPQERLDFMIADTRLSVLLTQQPLVSRLPEHEAQLVLIDTDWDQIKCEPKTNPATPMAPENLMYVMYTSGSTGQPKGAMNTHRALVNRLHWMQRIYQLTSNDSVLQKTPFSFDVSGWEFFWTLLAGSRLVIAKPEGHKDNVYLGQLITREAITTLHFVPSMLQVFVAEYNLAHCSSLKRVICSGEALPVDLQNRFLMHTSAELHNLYGPTEAAIDVTAWACRMDAEQSAVPIGRPIDNIQTYILDTHGQPAPVNVAGELFLGGVGLARGYWNRPALTAQKFVPNRYSMQEGQRLYRTGDLSHQRPDGVIEFIGRVDFQVKIRGFRVELGEIEAVLSQHAAVREAVVVLSEEIPDDKRLVAYLVPFEPSPTIGELRRFLFDRLPDYMVPASFVLLDALPLTPNGKVDRRTLPTPRLDRAHLETEYVAPRTPMEEKLADIWADVLHVDVGIYDHFFELGGHSLLATQVVSRIRDTFQVEISLQQLFDYPILADLMALITEAQTTTVTQEVEMMPPIKKEGEDNEQLLAKLDQLSEQEVNILLNKMLNKTEID